MKTGKCFYCDGRIRVVAKGGCRTEPENESDAEIADHPKPGKTWGNLCPGSGHQPQAGTIEDHELENAPTMSAA